MSDRHEFQPIVIDGVQQLLAKGEIENACAALEGALEKAPRDGAIRQLLITTLIKVGDIDAARGHYAVLARVNPRAARSMDVPEEIRGVAREARPRGVLHRLTAAIISTFGPLIVVIAIGMFFTWLLRGVMGLSRLASGIAVVGFLGFLFCLLALSRSRAA